MSAEDNRHERIWLSPPCLGGSERGFLAEALDSNWIAPLGPQVDLFEREVAAAAGVAHGAALASGTAALHLGLVLLGVERGDEVLCSDLTFVAAANAIRYVGAVPIFVDSERASWNLSPELLAEELESRRRRGLVPPKAAIVVDLYGQCPDHAAIATICREHDVPVIEDAAEALGAACHGRPAGSHGRLGVFSFNGNKIITTSSGGMLVSDDRELVERTRFLASQARDPAPHYEHSSLGYNYRMSNLLAAVGRGQLVDLDERVAARRRIFASYRELLGDLPGLEFQPEAPWGRSNRWLTCLTVDPERFGADREAIRLALEAEDIEARPVWKPMHLQPLYDGCRVVGGAVSAELFDRGLCLPSGHALGRADLERIAAIVRRSQRS